jgi:hypothetical protein
MHDFIQLSFSCWVTNEFYSDCIQATDEPFEEGTMLFVGDICVVLQGSKWSIVTNNFQSSQDS